MGIDRFRFLGPYLRISKVKTKRTKSTQCCPNARCSQHKHWSKDTFCPACGSRITIITWSAHGVYDIQSVLDDLRGLLDRDTFATDPYCKDIAYPSRNKWADGTCWNVDVEDISPERVAVEIENFKEKYASEIKVIAKHLGGPHTVRALWGLIEYEA